MGHRRMNVSLEQRKVPNAVLPESPSEARPERAECGAHPGGSRKETTESQLGLSANRSTDRLGVSDPNRQRRGSQDSRAALPAGAGLRWSFLADFPWAYERQPLEYRSIQVRARHLAVPLGPGGHGLDQFTRRIIGRACGNGRWCRTLSDVQPRHSWAMLDAEEIGRASCRER